MSTNDSMAVNYDDLPKLAHATNEKLREAWELGNKEAYTRAYKEFATFLELPMLEPDGVGIELVSATNGASLGFRHKTTADEDKQILADARTAHSLLSKLPVTFRQGMLTYFLEHSFPKVVYAAALAQTASMGKTISEGLSEVEGKGKAWFEFAASETVRDYIESYATEGIRTGYHISKPDGTPITTRAEFDAHQGASIITKYPDNTNTHVPEDLVVKGSGVSGEQPAENYLALAFPGLSLPVVAGNASITKLRHTNQDSFEIVRTAFLHDTGEYMRKYGSSLPADIKREVNLEKEGTIEAILKGLAQSVSSRGWESVVNSYRIVAGMEVGHQVYDNRQASGLSEGDKARGIYELAGDNVMYIHDDVTKDELAKIVDQLIARLTSNSGMTCTRVNAVMVKKGETFDAFVKLFEAAWEKLDASAETSIHNPHDEATSQGALSNGKLFKDFQDSLDQDRRLGARVSGGRQLHTESGGFFTTLGYSVWPDRMKHNYELLRRTGKEIFGPKTNILPVDDVEEAVRITNLNGAGLSSAICAHDERVNAYFIGNTKLGSYNIFNPKGSSDNSPGGEHIAVYDNAIYTGADGIEHNLTIPENGPTGGLAQVAHHLNAPIVNPQKSIWVNRAEAGKLVAELGIKLR